MTNSNEVQQWKNRQLRRSLMRLAEDWIENGYPVPIDQEFKVGSIKVRVQVEKAEDPQSTQPLGGKSLEAMSDRSQDA